MTPLSRFTILPCREINILHWVVCSDNEERWEIRKSQSIYWDTSSSRPLSWGHSPSGCGWWILAALGFSVACRRHCGIFSRLQECYYLYQDTSGHANTVLSENAIPLLPPPIRDGQSKGDGASSNRPPQALHVVIDYSIIA